MLNRLSNALLHYSAVAAAVFLVPALALGQAKPQLSGVKIDAKDRVELTHTIPVPLRTAADLGLASSNMPMKDMFLLLQPTKEQKAALDSFLAEVQNPASPKYHQWLTPAQFGEAYGPAKADVDTVTQWLSSQGFTVEQVAVSRGWIRFSGTVGLVENTFGTQVHSYELDGKKVYSNSSEVTLPRVLSGVVSGVLSLNNFEKHTLHTAPQTVMRSATGKLVTAPAEVKGVAANAVLASPNFTDDGQPEQNLLAPGDFAKIYDSASLISTGNNGSGVSIAIVGRSDISLSDVETFRTLFKLPFNDPTIINANDDPGVVSGDDQEAILDVEWSGAVAPGAEIKYVIGGTTAATDGIDISAMYIIDNRIAPIMSVSYGLCEQYIAPSEQAFYNDLWQQAAAEGISVLVSSGDSGSSSCAVPSASNHTTYGLGVSGLASTPYNTAVGGTEFTESSASTYWQDAVAGNLPVNPDQSSAKGYIPEAAWNESCNTAAPISIYNCYFTKGYADMYAGSGGPSSCSTHSDTPDATTGLYTCTSGYPKPSWQTGSGVPSDGVRDLPDVALAAAGVHDGYLICYDGGCQYDTQPDGSNVLLNAIIIGGTSAASPSMAGILALVEQKNGQFQGLVNPKLYALAAEQTGSCDSSMQTDPTQKTSCVFHDVTNGSNTLTCTGTAPGCTVAIPGVSTYEQLSGWAAGSGYDRSTGLGSVDIANLVSAWGNITQSATTTTLTLSSTTFTHGTVVNVTATTVPSTGSGTPSGAVALMAAGSTSSAGPVLASDLKDGTYSGSVSSLPGGTYQLTAQYGGDATFAASTSAPVSVTVTPEATVVAANVLAPSGAVITSSGLNSRYYLELKIAGASGAGSPTGTVTVTEGANKQPVGTFTVDRGGIVDIPCGPNTACDYPVGSYTFNLSYSGDSSFQAAAATLPFSVTKGTANWSVKNSMSTLAYTNSTVVSIVTFTYDPAVLPTGTVTLVRSDTGATLGTAPIDTNGTAVVTFSAPNGTYAVKATWPGDSNYIAGTGTASATLIVLNGGSTASTTTMTAAKTTATVGQSTSFTVTVASAGTSKTVPTGYVILYAPKYGQLTNATTIVNGIATLFVEWPYADTFQVYAAYRSDSTYAASSSATTAITVNKASAALTLSTVSPYVTVGGQASITATLSSSLIPDYAISPKGTVQFYDSVNGGAVTALGRPVLVNAGNGTIYLATIAPMLAAGTHSITALYSGDANWNSAASATGATIVATNPDFAISGPTAATVTAGQSAPIALTTTSVLGYLAPVSINCTGTLPQGVSCGTVIVTPGAAATLTLKTTAPGVATIASTGSSSSPWKVPGVVTLAGLLFFVIPRRRRFALMAFVVLGAVVTSITVSGCGGDGGTVDSSVTLSSSNTKVAYGSAVTLSAVVASSKNPSGSVTFYDAGASIGTAKLSNSIASLETSQLSVGTHTITATYSGDSHNNAAKSSTQLDQTVTGTFTLTVAAVSGSITHTASLPVTLQ